MWVETMIKYLSYCKNHTLQKAKSIFLNDVGCQLTKDQQGRNDLYL